MNFLSMWQFWIGIGIGIFIGSIIGYFVATFYFINTLENRLEEKRLQLLMKVEDDNLKMG